MATLKNVKHECFAQLISKGKNQSESYLKSGYNAIGDNIRKNAHKIATNSDVIARIKELQEKNDKKYDLSTEFTTRHLKELLINSLKRDINFEQKDGKEIPVEGDLKDTRLALEILKEINKMGGNYKDNKLNVNHSGNIDNKTTIELVAVSS